MKFYHIFVVGFNFFMFVIGLVILFLFYWNCCLQGVIYTLMKKKKKYFKVSLSLSESALTKFSAINYKFYYCIHIESVNHSINFCNGMRKCTSLMNVSGAKAMSFLHTLQISHLSLKRLTSSVLLKVGMEDILFPKLLIRTKIISIVNKYIYIYKGHFNIPSVFIKVFEKYLLLYCRHLECIRWLNLVKQSIFAGGIWSNLFCEKKLIFLTQSNCTAIVYSLMIFIIIAFGKFFILASTTMPLIFFPIVAIIFHKKSVTYPNLIFTAPAGLPTCKWILKNVENVLF